MAKLLLVEDDNNLREIYEARLTAEGYEIKAAQNGEEALSLAKDFRPDLIVSDVMMPRISGFEMLDILRNTDELKHTKVIMLTALGQVDDRNRADNLGADKYLVKSQVTLEDIVNAARDLLSSDDSTPVETTPVAEAATAAPAGVTTATVEPTEPAIELPTPLNIPASPVAATDPSPAEPVTPVAPDTPVTPTAEPTTEDSPPLQQSPATAEPPVLDAAPQPNVQDLEPQITTAVVADESPESTTETAAAEIQPELPTPPAPGSDVSETPVEQAIVPESATPSEPQISPVAQLWDDEDEVGPTTPAAEEPQTAEITPEAAVEALVADESNLPAPESDAPTAPIEAPSASAPTAPATTGSQSIEDEEAAIAAQLASFGASSQPSPAETPVAETPVSEKPVTTAPSPVAEIDTPESAASEQVRTQNAQILNDAISKLAAPSEETESDRPSAPSEPGQPKIISPHKEETETNAEPPVATEAAPESPEVQHVTGHKVIKPLNDIESNAPKLEELLAKEEAREAAEALPTPKVGTADMPAEPVNRDDPNSPNNVAL